MTDLDDAVARAASIFEAHVTDLTSIDHHPPVEDEGRAVSHTVTVEILETFKGQGAPGTQQSSVVATDELDSKGEVISKIGDHHSRALQPGTRVILFTTSPGDGFAIQPPRPIVVNGDRAELTTYGIDEASRSRADELAGTDGAEIETVRQMIRDTIAGQR